MNITKHVFTVFFIIVSFKIVGQNVPQLTIPTLDRFAINGICFIPSKNYIVSYGDDIKFWQLSDGRMVKKLKKY